MSFGNGPIARFLLERNAVQSAHYCDPGVTLARHLHRAQHSTAVFAFKCMDGRLNLALMSEIPVGIIQPFRNLGGMFDLGWPYLNELVRQSVVYETDHGRCCIFLLTYHWSKGERHRGCYGFHYDVDAAREFIFSLRRQVERVFGSEHSVVYPICMGIETDEDAYVLHGTNGDVLNLADWDAQHSEDDLRVVVERLYPDMHRDIVRDLLPILLGNIVHIGKVRADDRPLVAIDHRERAIVIGRGVGWLHEPNYAVIVGPFAPDLDEPLINAGRIVQRNLSEGRIPREEGALLMASAPYRDPVGIEPRLAIEKARMLAGFAYNLYRRELPELFQRLDVLVGIVDMGTQKFSQIDWEPASRN